MCLSLCVCMKCMCLHSCEYTHVPMCVSTCVHVWWGEEQRSTPDVFVACSPLYLLGCYLPMWSSLIQLHRCSSSPPTTTWPPVPAFLELDIQMCVACLHEHWGAKLRSVGLCGKMTGWAICPPPSFLFKGVRTWRWFILFYFFFKFAFHTIYFDHAISTPNTSQVLQKPNKWWNLKQTSNNPVRQNHQSQTKSQSVFASGVVWVINFTNKKWPGLIWVSALVLKGGNEFVESWGLRGAANSPPSKLSALTLSFSTSRAVKDKFLLFIKSPVCGTLLQYHKQARKHLQRNHPKLTTGKHLTYVLWGFFFLVGILYLCVLLKLDTQYVHHFLPWFGFAVLSRESTELALAVLHLPTQTKAFSGYSGFHNLAPANNLWPWHTGVFLIPHSGKWASVDASVPIQLTLAQIFLKY